MRAKTAFSDGGVLTGCRRPRVHWTGASPSARITLTDRACISAANGRKCRTEIRPARGTDLWGRHGLPLDRESVHLCRGERTEVPDPMVTLGTGWTVGSEGTRLS